MPLVCFVVKENVFFFLFLCVNMKPSETNCYLFSSNLWNTTKMINYNPPRTCVGEVVTENLL